MRKSFVALGVSTFIAAGCGGNEAAPKPVKTTVSTPAPAKPTKPEVRVYKGPANIPPDVLKRMGKDPVLKAMNEFRARIYEKRHAKVMLGVCATWPNVSGGFTATVNPGITGFTYKKKQATFPVFSAYNVKTLSWQVMNGPLSIDGPAGGLRSDDQGLALEFYRKNHTARAKDVALTDQPVVDQENRVYFKDKVSGTPVMLTGLAPTADYSETNIHAACDALRKHQALPGVLTT